MAQAWFPLIVDIIAAEMNNQANNPLHRIVDLISATIQRSDSAERNDLQSALSIFMQCSAEHMLLDPVTEQEIGDQIEWIHLYRSRQDQYPAYRAPLSNSLVPLVEDVDSLLPRFSHEVLEGARTVAHLLNVKQPNSWIEMESKRRPISYCDSDETQEELEFASNTSSEDGSDTELASDAIEYSYAYF